MTSLIAAAAALFSAQSGPRIEEAFDNALGVAGLSTKTARFDDNLIRLFGGGEFATTFYQSCSENPWRIPFFSDVIRRDLATLGGRPSDSILAGSRLLGFNLRRTLLDNPNKGSEERSAHTGALADVLARMSKEGLLLSPPPALSGVPPEAQHAAALVLDVMLRTVTYRRLAFRNVRDIASEYDFVASLPPGNNDDIQEAPFARLYDLYRNTDMRFLLAGGHDLTLAAQVAETFASKVPPTVKYDCRFQTKWGLVRLHGGTPTVYDNVPTALVIDTGGKDKYLNVPSNAGPLNWVSVVIDTDGDDLYLSDPDLEFKKVQDWPGRKQATSRPGPAGALFGYAVLVDSSGNDIYRSHRPGLGSGRLGVGVLLDKNGDDTYDSYADSEGFGTFGAGILEDENGTDHYDGFLQVQGCGQTMGFGYLVDRAGNDTYIANDTVIDFPSAQSALHNTSMSQGAGNGRRADYLEAHALSGGIGVLFDAAGNDTYQCSVFGQGTGYWNGVGMLWDSAGDDKYIGNWYVQGAAAHFAIGVLEDLSGNDIYSAGMNMAQGAGHDFSVGMLYEHGGDDKFASPSLSLGAGNANGIGVYVKDAGNAQYDLFTTVDKGTGKLLRPATTLILGRAAEAPKASLRSRALCLGLFLDLAGTNSFPHEASWAQPGARIANWTDRSLTPAESQVGVFWDK
jgi:hypothetical protein